MTMGVIDSYPEFVKNDELQAPAEMETLNLAVQEAHNNSLAALRSLVVDSVSAPNSKRAYGRAVDNFLAWHQLENRGPFSKALLQGGRAALEHIQLTLGHASIQTTERYYAQTVDMCSRQI